VSIYYQQLTSPEIRQAAERNTLILFPVGQVEEHGPHLPLEADCIIARETARAVAEQIGRELPVLVLPTVWAAYSVRQVARWPGLLSFRQPEPMIQMIYDILACLIEDGLRKIVLVNAHGNNPAILELALRRIGSDYDVFPALTNVVSMSKGAGAHVRRSAMGGCGGHADEFETALLLHLCPGLVHMDQASAVDRVTYRNRFFPGDSFSDIPDKVGGIFWSSWGVLEPKTGAMGDPSVATAEAGQQWFEAIVQTYVEFLREFYNH
jgi:creatinine amidohydrolase